jgi:hypothetical protein
LGWFQKVSVASRRFGFKKVKIWIVARERKKPAALSRGFFALLKILNGSAAAPYARLR